MKHEKRKKHILESALEVTREYGYFYLTRDKVAKRAKCSRALVQFHFNTSAELKTSVIQEANRVKDLAILSQIIGSYDPNVKFIDSGLVKPVLRYIKEQTICE